jgi:hypothetical protein
MQNKCENQVHKFLYKLGKIMLISHFSAYFYLSVVQNTMSILLPTWTAMKVN